MGQPVHATRRHADAETAAPDQNRWTAAEGFLRTAPSHGVAKWVGSRCSSLPPAWATLVARRPVYMASSAALSAAGVLLYAAAPWAHARVAADWPWAAFGAWWFLQGAFSWLADVTNLGRTSVWHTVDSQAAIFTALATAAFGKSFLRGGELGFGVGDVGFAAARSPAQLALRAGALGLLVLAAYAKRRSGRARHADAYFRWHATWHYAIALGLCAPLGDGLLPAVR